MPGEELSTRLDRLPIPRDHAPKETVRSALAPESAAVRAQPRSRELPVISVDLRVGPSDDEAPGRDLEVQGLLGEGGMGRVFLARQHSLDRDVAIKSLHEGEDERQRRALVNEGAITGHLEHPSIIPVHALGVDATGRPVLVMKRVEGVNWSELLRDHAHPLWKSRGGSPERRLDDHLEILIQICNAVHFAHSKRIVHRDIKPQNVMIGLFGDVYLADWGIAFRMGGAHRAEICGTPAYMAPEMVLGGPIDERTDVYLLGATLHEVLTGKVRHVGDSARGVMTDAAISAPVTYDSTVPGALAAIANRATHVDPGERFEDVAEMRAALRDYLRHKGSVALAAAALPRLERLRDLGGEDRASEQAQHDTDQCIAEARFALQQALEHWADNAEAKAQLGELDALVERRRARAAKLERLAQDLDPDVEAKTRLLGQSAVAVAGLGLSISAFVKGMRYEPTVAEIKRESLVPLAVVVLTAVFLRRRLLRTAFNRRVIFCCFVTTAMIAVSRFLGDAHGLRVPQLLTFDCLVVATTSLVTAPSTFRGMALASVTMLMAAVACAIAPDRAFFWFSLGMGVTMLLMLVVAPNYAQPKQHT